MTEVIGVRFRTAGKIYYFAPADIEFNRGEHAIVETARGVEYGFVVMGNRSMDDSKIVQPLKPVIRKATKEDDLRHEENSEKEQDAFRICLEKIRKHALEMKLIDVEYTFDRGKILFYFTADGRVDFRQLVKDLASVFRTRIELRQVGVRDETKMLGGYGVCGRPLCCHSFLSEFAPVSIKMAKEQGLSLNPSNISGVCGRLMCCLKNEEEVYEFLNSKLPSVGDLVTTPDGLKGEVNSVSVLNQKVKVIVDLEKEDEKELREYKVSELRFKPKRKKCAGNCGCPNKKGIDNKKLEEQAEIEALELAERQDAKAARENSMRENGEKENAGRDNGGRDKSRGNRERKEKGNLKNSDSRENGERNGARNNAQKDNVVQNNRVKDENKG